ncbi:hypothetical protein NF865_08680 [Thermococcus aggregans]|uniref:Uncharacterized protein n=1 Tax=Thermococcus aggregans TaxID=110163 RepID=A0A9E7SNJ2_THEAG|nr:hypothetical protein [Thermococcus aggregans]USS40375.1 hypothetical protein NF865_08680 [Thermococcus aggregans]
MVLIIGKLFYASKIYFSSYGVAWFDSETFLRLLRFVNTKQVVTPNEIGFFLKATSKNPLAKTGKEGYYFAKLLWHLGILVKSSGKNYQVSTYGKRILSSLKESKEDYKEALARIFKKWYPLIVFLRYIDDAGSVRPQDIVSELGGEMKYWTSILSQLGIIKKGNIAKPYNGFVVNSLFVPLSLELGLVEKRSGKLRLTKAGKEFIMYSTPENAPEIIRTMPGDYTIYAGIADVLYEAKEPVIVSPWINGTLEKLITTIQSLNSNLSKITLVIRNTKKNRTFVKELLRTTPLDIDARYYQNLHSKITSNYTGSSIESSANLLITSLKRNYEIGTYYPKTPEELSLAVEELVSISKPLTIF